MSIVHIPEPEHDGEFVDRPSRIEGWRSPELEAAVHRPTAEWTGPLTWVPKSKRGADQ